MYKNSKKKKGFSLAAFLYGLSLQFRLDIRSKTMLITCYLVPLLFFAVMGGIFTSIMPGCQDTLLPSMTVFGLSMGSLIGLPPSLVEIYGSDIQKAYKAGGVPRPLAALLINLSAFLHLFLMSLILCAAAPLLFDARLPENLPLYFLKVALFIPASLSFASVVGLAVREQTKTSMFSILLFLPSILFSGILFPSNLLPQGFQALGTVFPARWGYQLLRGPSFSSLTQLSLLFFLALTLCAGLLKRK